MGERERKLNVGVTTRLLESGSGLWCLAENPPGTPNHHDWSVVLDSCAPLKAILITRESFKHLTLLASSGNPVTRQGAGQLVLRTHRRNGMACQHDYRVSNADSIS